MLKDTEGYTLIELVVVIVLIGMMMTLTIPKLRSVNLFDDLKSSTRRMAGLIRSTRYDAIRDNIAYRLHFDLESREFWVDSPAMSEEEKARAREDASGMADDIFVEDITYSNEKKAITGSSSILFTKKGYIQPAIIHLGSKGGKRFSLIMSPFLGKVKVFDDYVDYDDL